MNAHFKIKSENMNNKYGLSFELWTEKGVGEDKRYSKRYIQCIKYKPVLPFASDNIFSFEG